MSDFLNWFGQVTVGEVICALLFCALIHETLVFVLPDSVAGPGGWLINTARSED